MLFIYISEAHATDVWPIGASAGTDNKKHLTIEDRGQCAQKFIDAFSFAIPTYLDTMEDEVRDSFAAWPFRFFMINHDKSDFRFHHIGYPDDSEFDLLTVLDHI